MRGKGQPSPLGLLENLDAGNWAGKPLSHFRYEGGLDTGPAQSKQQGIQDANCSHCVQQHRKWEGRPRPPLELPCPRAEVRPVTGWEGIALPGLCGATHRSFLPLGLGFPASVRSSSSDGCTYRNRLKVKEVRKAWPGAPAKSLSLVLRLEHPESWGRGQPCGKVNQGAWV